MIHLAKHQRRQLCVPTAVLPQRYHHASIQLAIWQARFEQPLSLQSVFQSFL